MQSFLDHVCVTLLYLPVELLVCQMALAETGDREFELVLSEVKHAHALSTKANAGLTSRDKLHS